MALRVAGAVKAFASESNKNALFAQAYLNPSEFTRDRDDERDDIAQRVHDLGNENAAGSRKHCRNNRCTEDGCQKNRR
jgi:hypothetical protein